MALPELFSAISNIVSALTSWRLGLVLALVGTSVHLARVYGPLSELDQQWYHGALIAGLVGLSILLVHGLILLAQGISFAAPRIGQLMLMPLTRKKERELAKERVRREREFAEEKAKRELELSLRNFDTLTEHELNCLLWIKQAGNKRFKASRRISELVRLYQAHLLEREVSQREEKEHAVFVHWIVPDHVWSRLEKINVKDRYFSSTPPWGIRRVRRRV